MSKNVLVVGCGGQMGGYYIDNLLKNLGFNPDDIVGVEIDPEKIEKFQVKYPGISVFRCLDQAFEAGEVRCAIITTNTPSHHTVAVELIRRGVDHIFIEKPLALDEEKVAFIRANMRSKTRIFTAFLINFSGAIRHVEDLMKAEGLFLSEAFVNWGKDRTGNNRPSSGDLEDESVHGVGVVHILAQVNQEVRNIKLMAKMSHLSFVDSAVQAKAHALDESFPLPSQVNSSSMIIETIETSRGSILASTRSSFVNLAQVRQVSLVLSGMVSGVPECLVQMDFDTREGDILLVKRPGKKGEERFVFVGNKVMEETKAFLDVVSGQGPQDPRLTDFAGAEMAVAVSEAVKESHRLGTEVVVR